MRNKQFGFTAMELIVVIAIVGILAAISGPSFSSLMASSRLSFSQQIVETSLGTAFSTARSKPKVVHIRGWKDSRSLEIVSGGTSLDFEKEPCSISEQTCQQLDRGVTFDDYFEFKFVPPYGDLDPNTGKTEIRLNSGDKSVRMNIHHASGLVETLSPETK